MAELTPEEKDAISHRGRAARALVAQLLAAEEAERPPGPLRSLLGGLGERRRGAPAANETAGARDARQRTAALSVAAAVFLVVDQARHRHRDRLARLPRRGGALRHGPRGRPAHPVRGARRRPAARPRAPLRPREGRAPRRPRRERVPAARVAVHRLESLRRLIDGGSGQDIDVTWWALAVLGVVIAVDASRALASFRAVAPLRLRGAGRERAPLQLRPGRLGRRARSASCSSRAGEPSADAAAALFVAVLVVLAAVRLAKRSIDVLMDRTVADADDRIRAALAQAGEQVELRRVRVRHAGGRHFVDLVVGVPLDSGRDPGARGRRPDRGRGRARARRRRRGRARGADRGGGRHARARHGRRGAHPGGARGPQRARDAAAGGLRAVAAREAAARACRSTRRTTRSSGSSSACGRRCRSCGWCTRTSSRSRAPTGRARRRATTPPSSATRSSPP